MGLLGGLFRKAPEPADSRPIAHPGVFQGPGPYSKSLDLACGVVFEDDGEVGYFYATDAAQSEIFDALQVYNRASGAGLEPGAEFFFVWNPALKRAGLFFDGRFQAVFDFTLKRGVCRSGFPTSSSSPEWSAGGHAWDETLVAGIEP